ncbi:MAG TPA: hypothetical protein DCP91_06630, partial [Eggerthellaceae bacterium]|nr:hypothetical protein [Eggerthellaceae bacterium]
AVAKRYIPAIDGLRAFAVFAVIFYHMGAPFAQGGLLGVTVFFVISGYLITGLLTAEWESTRTINLPQFWLRRIRRLFPAIFTVILVMAAVFTIFSPLLLTKMRPDILPGLFWFQNWWYILRDISYFDAVGAPSPLTHFWSLAIEEQFYLIWPIILLGVFKAGMGRTGVRRACLVLAVVSAVAMAVLYVPQGDPSRVYYGTDTRAFSLLIGAWLSFAWPGAQLTEEGTRNVPAASIRALDIAGIAAFLGIVAMCVFISGYSDFMYYGGLVLCSALSAVVIAVLAHPRSMFARVAQLKPFVWIGQRSYGMYLWHYPIIELLQPRNATMLPWWIYLVEIALTVLVAHVSYELIETPIRKRGLSAFRAPDPTTTGAGVEPRATFRGWVRTHIPAVAVTGVIAAVAVFGIAFVPPVSEGGAAPNETRVMSATLKKPLVDGVYDVVLIGDSVSLGANEQLNEKFPHGLIDTEGSRQFAAGIEAYQGYLDRGIVGDTVIFSLGTNGYAEPDELQQIVDMSGPDRTVWFVNTRVPDERCEPNNQAIQACVDANGNTNLIDWFGASTGHDEWLSEDGIHLTWDGRDAYANLVVDTIGYVQPDDENTKYDVTFMGDIVALDAVDELAELFPHGIVDCSEGRSLNATKDAFQAYLDKGVVGDDVVLCLGNEEILDRDTLRQLIEAAGTDRTVWLVNNRTAGMWMSANNDLLAELANGADNVKLVDWFGASQGHDDYLAENGMNLTEAGVTAFADTVHAALGDHTASAKTSDQAAAADNAESGDGNAETDAQAAAEASGAQDASDSATSALMDL